MNEFPKSIFLFYIVGKIENQDFLEWLSYDQISTAPLELIPENCETDVDIYFYGFTTSKKISKEFMKLRNKDKIISFEKSATEYFTDEEEFKTFQRQFRTCEIVKVSLGTKVIKNKKIDCLNIDMYLTQFEKEFICTSFEGLDDRTYNAFEEIQNVNVIFGCLSSKIKNALCNIGFIDFIYYLKNSYGEESNDSIPIVEMDELSVLIDYFGELFEGGMSKI